ncbi:2-succinyl-6-hydroxy-2,4-cyclohexadiene-1-carboxylate synthase [Alginatibacterium sediminis]|nr:2-succinyl-6-hydroxy-2,4-cyclohexadiene-1-carboxylate synthase [Alginatibacterium sediminis]
MTHKPSIKPTLVLLHGFLGQSIDWQQHIELLSKRFNCIALDLAFHGKNAQQSCDGIPGYARHIRRQLQQQAIGDFHLLGYSLGGRVAIELCLQNLSSNEFEIQSLIIESSHFGLSSNNERSQRWQADQQWAERFVRQDLKQTLQQWYQQSVFESLPPALRERIIKQRQTQDPEILAQAILSASIAKQNDYSQALARLDFPVMLINGELDTKYQQFYQAHVKSFNHCHWNPIPLAGHNTHLEQPQTFCNAVINFIG